MEQVMQNYSNLKHRANKEPQVLARSLAGGFAFAYFAQAALFIIINLLLIAMLS